MSFSMRALLLLILLNMCCAEPNATGCLATAVVAAGQGDLKGIQSCLAIGWDVNAKDNDGVSALHFAAGNGTLDVIAALIKAGADVNAKNNVGVSALHFAAGNGTLDAIAFLTKAGADVNSKDNNGFTVLHHAALGGNVDAVAVLIDADADVTAKNKEGDTARDIAHNNKPSMFDLFGSNDFSEIVEIIDKHSEALQAQKDKIEEAEEITSKLKELKEDWLKYPALKLLSESLIQFEGIEQFKKDLTVKIKTAAVELELNPNKCKRLDQYNEAWVLRGGPGTGKTSIAREITPVLFKAGIVPKSLFKEV